MSKGRKKINGCKELTIKINDILLFSKPLMLIKIGQFTANRTVATCNVSKRTTGRASAFQRLRRKTVNNVKKHFVLQRNSAVSTPDI
jgi:hypothetical protein